MEIFDIEQGSPEWFDARLGIITSSEFNDVLTNGRGGNPSKTRETLILKKAAERITGTPTETYTNGFMERGKELEPIAREIYEEKIGLDVKKVGFIRNGCFGASTDGLVGDDGVVEIKTRMAHLQINVLMKESFKEHKAQMQGALLISGRQWSDYLSYCPGMPLFYHREYRDNEYIRILKEKLELAEEEIKTVIEFIKNKF